MLRLSLVVAVLALALPGAALAQDPYLDPALSSQLTELLRAKWPNRYSADEQALGLDGAAQDVRRGLWRARISAKALPDFQTMVGFFNYSEAEGGLTVKLQRNIDAKWFQFGAGAAWGSWAPDDTFSDVRWWSACPLIGHPTPGCELELFGLRRSEWVVEHRQPDTRWNSFGRIRILNPAGAGECWFWQGEWRCDLGVTPTEDALMRYLWIVQARLPGFLDPVDDTCRYGNTGNLFPCFVHAMSFTEMEERVPLQKFDTWDASKDPTDRVYPRNCCTYVVPSELDLDAARAYLSGGDAEATAARVWINGRLGAPPTVVRGPAILARPEVGRPVTADLGEYASATTFGYRWWKCAGGGSCTEIYGANGPVYTPSIIDLGFCLKLEVGAWNDVGSAAAESPPSCTVAMPLSEELAAAIAFRPVLLFDSAEPRRPLNVNFLFAEAGNKLCRAISGGSDPCSAEGPIAYFTCGVFGSPCFADPAPPRLDAYDYVDIDDALPAELNRGPQSAVYYNLSRHDGIYYVDYWVFYKHNAGPYWPDHEGDWEGVAVATDTLDATRRPLFVAFRQHEGDPKRYLNVNVEYDGVHAHVFVARGSHASYPVSCPSLCSQDGHARPEGSFDGRAPWGWNGPDDCARECVLPLPESDTDVDASPEAASWASWPGRWGNTLTVCSELPGCASPESPGLHHAYRAPWDWAPFVRARFKAADVDAQCETWLGFGVAALVCDPVAAQAALTSGRFRDGASFTLSRRGSGTAAGAPGLAQLLGEPLGAGEVLQLEGGVPDEASVVVRVQSPDGGSRRVVIDAEQLGLSGGGSASIVVRPDGLGGLTAGPNRPPNCSTPSRALWPPNGLLVPIRISVTDPDGDPVTVEITGVAQDEPLTGAADAEPGSRPAEVLLRASRLGNGDGRVYRVAFGASDGIDGCAGTALVGVPHDQAHPAVSGPLRVDSFGP